MKPNGDSIWRVNGLIIWHLIAVLLLASWFLPPTRSLWLASDEFCFRLFNDSLKTGNDAWRMFWALTNHRLFDIVSAGLLILVFLYSAWRNGRTTWPWHFALISVTALAAFIGTRIGHLIPVERASGAMVLDDVFRLNDWATDFETKDSSDSTFPGDHAMVAIIGVGYAFRYLARNYAWAAMVAGLVILLPRLVGGAHWLSDELVGAGFVGIVVLSWSFYTPLADRSVAFAQRIWGRIWQR